MAVLPDAPEGEDEAASSYQRAKEALFDLFLARQRGVVSKAGAHQDAQSQVDAAIKAANRWGMVRQLHPKELRARTYMYCVHGGQGLVKWTLRACTFMHRRPSRHVLPKHASSADMAVGDSALACSFSLILRPAPSIPPPPTPHPPTPQVRPGGMG